MAGPKDVTVRVQALDGTWDVLGNTGGRGVWPEGVSLEADAWGSARASFSLRRDPTSFWPDIGAFTPVEVEVGSTLAWSGRVSETPARVAQRVMNVQCEGWQYHLDDDLVARKYVHTSVADWRDIRSFPLADLATFTSAPQVSTDRGVATLAFPANVVAQNIKGCGIGLDMGPGQLAKRIVVDYDWANPTGNTGIKFACTATSTDVPERGFTGVADQFVVGLATGPGSSTTRATINGGAGARYLWLQLMSAVGGDVTPTADVYARIKAVRVFTETAYESGDASVLKASTVVADAVSRGTLLLSSDTSGITTTSFSIPEYAPGAPQTPRQAWQAVDSFHDWHKQIDVNKRPVYTARPSRPIFEVGAWSAIDDDDASANSGEEIYNRAYVTGQTPDGAPISIRRPSGTIGTQLYENKLSGLWIAASSGSSFFFNTIGVTFKRNVTYAVRIRTITGDPATFTNVSIGDPNAPDMVAVGTYPSPFTGPGDWFFWTPTADRTRFGVQADVSVDANVQIWFEAWTGGSLPDRRNFNRSMTLPINAALPMDTAGTSTAANQIADVWMTGHRTTPFKGSVTLTGDNSLRNILTGHNVPLETLLLNTGQLLRFSDRSDPDTGGHSRDGRIASVTYTPATDTAQVTIDNSRTSFESLLARLSVIQGG